jgi:transcriptional regulator with XRE-family HTH domain
MIGHKIRAIRIKKGIDTLTLADALGLTKQAVGRIERNEVDISYENLKSISETLGVSIPDIEDYEDTYNFNIYNNTNSQGLGVINYFNNSNSKEIIQLLNNIFEMQKEILILLSKTKSL